MAERWRSGAVLVLSVLLLLGVVWVGPGDELAAFRRMLGIGGDRLGTPADVRPGGVHSFLQTQPGRPDEPVAWDPCRAIRYEINPDGASAGEGEVETFVAEAVSVVARFTGLRFEYVGRTDRRPEWARAFVPIGNREPVLISWATASEVRELRGDVAGIGGAVAVSVRSGDWLRYVTGGVTLDADTYADLADDRDGDAYARAILLHELGHLVGLGHVDSPAELMYDDNLGRLDFSTGDLNGLVRLGEGRCA